MSVHRRKRAGGRVVWQVTWRDPNGAQRAVIRPCRCSPRSPDDLAAWRSASSPPSDEAPIAPRSDGGGWWTATDYRNSRHRHFDPAVERAALPVTRPYDLRHSYASLMVQAGYSAVELAAELGHSPTSTLDTYAHVFSEFARGERLPPGVAIRDARQAEPAAPCQAIRVRGSATETSKATPSNS